MVLKEAGAAAVTQNKHVVVIMDGVDELSTVNAPHSLDWLPTVLPLGIRIIISVATGNVATLEALGTCFTAPVRCFCVRCG